MIKSAYQDVIAFLELNKAKKVATIMPELLEIVSSKSNSKTFIKDADGNITHIFCYYHKKWEKLSEVEYGNKKHSTTGFNTMCKEGVNQWSLQQREYKKNISALLDQAVANGWDTATIADKKIALEEAKDEVVERKDGLGSDLPI